MKMKKFLALALVAAMSLSTLTACGGDEEEYVEDEVIEEEEVLEEEPAEEEVLEEEPQDEVCSEETWAEHIKYMGVIGQMLSAFNEAETVPEVVVEVNNDVSAFADAYQSKSREDCTEAEMQEVLTNLKAAVGILSDYVVVNDDGTITLADASAASAAVGVSAETWDEYSSMCVAVASVVQQIQDLGENMSDDIAEYAQTAFPRIKELLALEQSTAAEDEVKAATAELDQIGLDITTLLAAQG